MHCYIHRDADAVGACKHCGKGHCGECAVDLEHGLSCRGPHEAIVEAISSLVVRNSRAATPMAWFISPAFFAFMGLLFLVYGVMAGMRAGSLVALLGLGFIVYAAFLFVVSYRAFKAQGRTSR